MSTLVLPKQHIKLYCPSLQTPLSATQRQVARNEPLTTSQQPPTTGHNMWAITSHPLSWWLATWWLNLWWLVASHDG